MEPTLRDRFAGYALMGLIARPYPDKPEKVAETAYAYADAMLKERENNKESDGDVYINGIFYKKSDIENAMSGLVPLKNGGSYSPTSKGNSNN